MLPCWTEGFLFLLQGLIGPVGDMGPEGPAGPKVSLYSIYFYLKRSSVPCFVLFIFVLLQAQYLLFGCFTVIKYAIFKK